MSTSIVSRIRRLRRATHALTFWSSASLQLNSLTGLVRDYVGTAQKKYSREHVCGTKFYALMGADDEDDLLETETDRNGDEDGETMVITGDVSSIHVITPKIRPRAIRLKGRINGSEVSVLIDGGSTHNFIKPTIAEQLSLPVHAISPFRVFVGNGESLRCSYACLQTPIMMQGHAFDIDLFILQVKGPDVILGVQWLQELGDVTKNYRDLTIKARVRLNCDKI